MTFALGFRVLLVEDKPDSRDAAIEALERILVGCEVQWVADREAAMSILAASHFDLAVCDLKIPARTDELDTDESNGFAVVSAFEQDHPGTPIIILSAWASLDNTETHIRTASAVSGFGVSNLPMCQVAVKGRPDDIEARLQQIADGLQLWESIPVEVPADTDHLLIRAIRHLATVRGYTSATIDRAGGLSGSSNAFATLLAPGRLPMKVFVKMDAVHWIEDEDRRRREFVEGHLEPGAWAATLEIQKVGLRDRAASFSSVSTAAGLFEEITLRPENAARTVELIEGAVAHWNMGGDPIVSTVGDLRRAHLSDEATGELRIELSEFEDVETMTLTYPTNVIHGDLHGENVLVRADLGPLLIDFAYTEVGPSVTDAVTLEMSLLFHPGSPLAESHLANIRFEDWVSGHYLPDDTYQPFVDQCRSWALRSGDEFAFLAFAYAHALRQMKHDNVPRTRCLSIARGIASELVRLQSSRLT